MNLPALKYELLHDPLNLGLSGMTDTVAASTLNATSGTLVTGVSDTSNLFGHVVTRSLSGFTAEQTLACMSLMGLPRQWLSASATASINALFPNAVSRNQVLALFTYSLSRANYLGCGIVTSQDVTNARSMT